jgi:phosphohistidine phosphatase
MKTLYVVRHAKSSWEDPLLDDFSRPLNERGKKDAPRMAMRLKEKNAAIDLVLSSPARRALGTAKRIAEVLNYNQDKIKSNPDLYHATPNKIFEVIRSVTDKHNVLLLVGHNTGLTEFVNKLMNQQIDNIPTCGIAACELDIESWREIKEGIGKLIFYDYPKSSKKTD